MGELRPDIKWGGYILRVNGKRIYVTGDTEINMDSILIKDTTREERERIVAESIGNIDGSCDGCSAGLIEMYQPYIDGVKEIREINMEFRAHYESGIDGPVKKECGYKM